jgi:tRNA-2-methylthio-N6-dimethylallyladenosine synthase
VNSYTSDGKKCFPDLLRKIDTLGDKGLSRLRFTSPHPQDFTDEVTDTLAAMQTSCPHIHLPAQHGSDETLKAMHRNYTAEQYEKIVAQVREKIPGAAITTDIIVGFPGETEADFQALCDFAERVRFDFSFTAIYFPRRHTPAAERTDQFIDVSEKKRRFHVFDEIVQRTAGKNRDGLRGKMLHILVEKVHKTADGTWRNCGRSREFYETEFITDNPMMGQEVGVKITGRNGYILRGTC